MRCHRYIMMIATGAIAAIMMLAAVPGLRAQVSVKLKDISFIDGLKENQLYGYGLVVGLQGSGDTRRSPMTKSSLQNLLKTLGMEGDDIAAVNTAAVLITARLPAFASVGDRIDVTVSSIGDAKSLEGGILVQSPLRGADGQIYAVAQGPLAVPKSAGIRRRGVTTVSAVAGGALVERAVEPEVVTIVKENENENVRFLYLVLKDWDYTVADAIIKAVAALYPASEPSIDRGGGKIRIRLVENVSLPEFISTIENIEVAPSDRAKVVVNERDGTVVTGGGVRVSAAMVSREGLTVEIRGTGGKGAAAEIRDVATVKDLVDALNVTGATTADIIAILKALETSGALHAELIVR
ncbi:MAG: flagellar basal body P-ring protein FlgI [Spirochaetes bacterium]|nr:flagellar basal body P-ring protein FlgI [Spirochaetota bacterium]